MATSSLAYCPSAEYLADRFPGGIGRTESENGSRTFQAYLKTPLAWTKEEIEKEIEGDCKLKLSTHDVQVLEAAAEWFENSGIGLSDISPETFPITEPLAARLRGVSDKCYHGRGFVVITGLDPTRYSPKEKVIIYAGIAAYVAPQRGFLDKNHKKVLCHVVNANHKRPKDCSVNKSPGFTDGPLAFHTDNCEILGLFALDMATHGGQTYVASAYQLYNELARNRPDVLQTLSDHWVLDTFTDYTQNPPIVRPMLHVGSCDNNSSSNNSNNNNNNNTHQPVVFTYSRFPMAGFGGRTRNPCLPPATAAQIEAMDTVQYVLSRNAVALPWRRGDVAFVNDTAIMHAREGFREGRGLQRHLLKFYLRDPRQGWRIPPTARRHWEVVYGPNRPDGSRDEEWCIHYEEGQEDSWMSNG